MTFLGRNELWFQLDKRKSLLRWPSKDTGPAIIRVEIPNGWSLKEKDNPCFVVNIVPIRLLQQWSIYKTRVTIVLGDCCRPWAPIQKGTPLSWQIWNFSKPRTEKFFGISFTFHNWNCYSKSSSRFLAECIISYSHLHVGELPSDRSLSNTEEWRWVR